MIAPSRITTLENALSDLWKVRDGLFWAYIDNPSASSPNPQHLIDPVIKSVYALLVAEQQKGKVRV